MVTLPVAYIDGIGTILNQITCSHILLLSQNVFYSQNELPKAFPPNYKTFTLYTKYWPEVNQSLLNKYFTVPNRRKFSDDFLPLSYLNEVVKPEHLIINPRFALWYEPYLFSPQDYILYGSSSCLFCISVFPKAIWKFNV